jgi:tetratricopeptide (TPR) repeat protein
MTHFLLLLAAPFILAPGQDQEADAARKAVEARLAAGEKDDVVRWFRENADGALAFIDYYFEGGLAIIEAGGEADRPRALFDTGRKFAALADLAFEETIFSKYGEAFTGWDREQQKRFRKGQQKFGESRKALRENDVEAAIYAARESVELARPLGDAWGVAMASLSLGTALEKAGRHDDARKALRDAAELNSRLRLRTAEISARLALAEAEAGGGDKSAAVATLRAAYGKLTKSDPESMVAKVRDALAGALEAAGEKEEAAKLRGDKP